MNAKHFMELMKRILKYKNLGLDRPFLICPAISFFPGEKNSKRVLTIAVVCDIIYLQKGREKKMNCKDCVCMGYNEDGILCCLADPRWPAPCEYENDYKEEE